ncbi:hypothetical protein ACFVZL_33440 [Streptomyces sp. NPDC058320]|uniref:hypothetical protein n=1 Tax=unclassified Streptomyces TaxID=2593676 RepID=UPI0035E1277B
MRSAWIDHTGELHIIAGTLMRLQVDRLPGGGDPPGDLRVTGSGPGQIGGRQPNPPTPSPLLSRQPAVIGIPHPSGMAGSPRSVPAPEQHHRAGIG